MQHDFPSAGPSVEAALAALNSRVPHRYSAIFQLDNLVLHCRHLVDKRGESNEFFFKPVPLNDSFCQFAIKSGIFEVENSGSDQRLAGHPNRGVMPAYHAVALVDGNGELYGSLCHMDLVPQVIPAGEMDYLREAADRIGAMLTRSLA